MWWNGSTWKYNYNRKDKCKNETWKIERKRNDSLILRIITLLHMLMDIYRKLETWPSNDDKYLMKVKRHKHQAGSVMTLHAWHICGGKNMLRNKKNFAFCLLKQEQPLRIHLDWALFFFTNEALAWSKVKSMNLNILLLV